MAILALEKVKAEKWTNVGAIPRNQAVDPANKERMTSEPSDEVSGGWFLVCGLWCVPWQLLNGENRIGRRMQDAGCSIEDV